MDIQEFVELVKEHTVLVHPYADRKPYVDRTVIPHFVPTIKGYRLGNVIWGSESPDVYFHVRYEGTVVLKHTDNRYPDTIHSYMFLPMALFKNGKPSRGIFFFSFEGDSLSYFKDAGLKIGPLQDNGTYPVDLSCVTFESFHEGEYSAEKLCNLYKEEFEAKAVVKVAKYFLGEGVHEVLKDKWYGWRERYDNTFVDILRENGVTDDGFSLSYKKNKDKPLLEIKLKGLSNLPKVEDVISRTEEGKKQTSAGAIMAATVEKVLSREISQDDMMSIFNEAKENQSRISKRIREIKYGLILENKWFEEFSEKHNAVLEDKDQVYNIVYNG